jgi:acyl-CoA thioester hydrolase
MKESSTKIRVTWADTDAAGIVHFSNYLRFFERAEEEFLNKKKLSYSSIIKKYKVRLPRVEAHCRYLAPCRYNDLILVKMVLESIKNRSFKESFVVENLTTGKRSAEGYIVCVSTGLDLKKAVPLPNKLAVELGGRESASRC